MLLMIVICIRDRIHHSIHQYVVANNKYMKGYDKSEILSNVFGCKWLHIGYVTKIASRCFEWIDRCKFTKDFIKLLWR